MRVGLWDTALKFLSPGPRNDVTDHLVCTYNKLCATYEGRLNFKRIATVMSRNSLTSLCCRISSVGRALDCRGEGRGFFLIPGTRPINTHGLKKTEK